MGLAGGLCLASKRRTAFGTASQGSASRFCNDQYTQVNTLRRGRRGRLDRKVVAAQNSNHLLTTLFRSPAVEPCAASLHITDCLFPPFLPSSAHHFSARVIAEVDPFPVQPPQNPRNSNKVLEASRADACDEAIPCPAAELLPRPPTPVLQQSDLSQLNDMR